MSSLSSLGFLFTSGVKSPHHAHLGYGLKRGLEGAPRALILTLESACVELVASRREMSGTLIALDRRGEERWRGPVTVTAGHDLAGRPNFAVSGACPEESALDDTHAWSWWPDEMSSHQMSSSERAELVTPSELIDYLERNQKHGERRRKEHRGEAKGGLDPSARRERPDLNPHQRSRYVHVLVGIFIVLIASLYVYQRGSQRVDKLQREIDRPDLSLMNAPNPLIIERAPDQGAPRLDRLDRSARPLRRFDGTPTHEPHHEPARDLID